jgi:hypothetical protein
LLITSQNLLLVTTIDQKKKSYKKYRNAAIPTITATGNQIYCPGTQQKIVETVTITNDPLEPTTKSQYK